ncbi:hypothetical protein DASC09_037260 [Saccharomycopsis crataegensis]|uniref:Fe2OG dioxygenase domain-containing protein n=1 Tax=Saccharomycopsis crataegensis TaxID=43959 RepID=A0AAV5QNV7_9ASCO|nr:hypothetical protein DASC09_037260 [Saccharomycopsis crataegensis]
MPEENPLKVIDLKNPDKQQIVDDLLEAAQTQGFLFIDGHDFSQKEIDELLGLSKKFFQLPTLEKAKYPIDETNKGYSCLRSEKLDLSEEAKTSGDPKEAWNFGDITFEDGKPHQDMPLLFKDPVNEKLVETVNKKLYHVILESLRYLSIGLKIEKAAGGEHWFANKNRPNEPNGSILRFLKYPSQDSFDSSTLIRAGAHTDYGTVTALFQFEGQEGLEIYANGWKKVPYISSKYPGSAPPLIVNFGDQLSYWTAGILKSTIHRVQFPESSIRDKKDRYSIVFFSHPEHDTLLEPIPSDIIRAAKGRGANNTADGDLLTARQHLDNKLNATYFRK